MDGLSSTDPFEIQLERNAILQVIRGLCGKIPVHFKPQTGFFGGGRMHPCLWGT